MVAVYVGVADGTALVRSDRVDRLSSRRIEAQVDTSERSGVRMYLCGHKMPREVLPKVAVRFGGRVISRQDILHPPKPFVPPSRYTVDGTLESPEPPEEIDREFDSFVMGWDDEFWGPDAEDFGFEGDPPIYKAHPNYCADNRCWKRGCKARKQWQKPSALRRLAA